jgi:hypothetical protein
MIYVLIVLIIAGAAALILTPDRGIDPLEIIDRELIRLHEDLDGYVKLNRDNDSYRALMAEVSRLNQAIMEIKQHKGENHEK